MEIPSASPSVPGTVIIYGPFFARSGFGLLARGTAMSLLRVGAKVRIVPVDCNDPRAGGDLDDVDLYLLQSLKFTPIVGPVTAIFAYVPTYLWPKMTLPEPHRRIMLTTFDSSAQAASPPARLIFICNQMDQIWVANKSEEAAWVRGGIDPKKIHSFNWAHEWFDNPLIGPPVPRERVSNTPFRFLHISLFLPRRRLDVLIRAFFEEFPEASSAELYLKMSYPSWHPLPGKPKKDLQELVQRLRLETGSDAAVTIDETLGTRRELARLFDASDAYVSPDTTVTAPVTEAIIRERPVIITDGWGVELPPQAIVVPNSTEQVAITTEMADYMPHQRGASFPALSVPQMRHALRQVFRMTAEERDRSVKAAMQFMHDRYSYEKIGPNIAKLIHQEWERPLTPTPTSAAKLTPTSRPPIPRKIHIGGLQLFHGKLPKFNRHIALELLRRGHQVTLSPGNGPFHIEELDLNHPSEHLTLAHRFHAPLAGPADVNLSSRWHPVFGEFPAAKQILFNTWWSGTIPFDWVRPINESVNEVWVPSRFVRENFLSAGVDPARMQVVPFGVDPETFKPGLAPYPLQTRKTFKFLFVGETTPRRGFDILLATYLKTFTSRHDVCLVVKDMDCEDYYARVSARKVVAECQANPLCPEMEYITTMLGESELARLYAACDCLVLPHRTASFNLTALEAMTCELPVITTDFGGVREFATTDTAYLLPAKIIRQRNSRVGHWRVEGQQQHAEIDPAVLGDRMRYVFNHASDARRKGIRAGKSVRQNFTWTKAADTVVKRLETVLSLPETRKKPSSIATPPTAALPASPEGPTVVMFAPFYNRSGYGVAARALAAAWHAAGVRIRIMPVDNVEEGVDDCDLVWLKSLERTSVTSPVIAVFFHVASPKWVDVKLPPGTVRVLYTTFDGTAQGLKPPPDWVAVCNAMDQLWLQTEKEAAVFISAGVPRERIRVLSCPHPWINNPSLPAATPKAADAPFRFLCIAMFQPRRRWDALIEAFLAEFKDTPGVELYLKVNYPGWHPQPGQPRLDLLNLIERLRAKTRSSATIVLDEDLGTRAGICRVIDSCDAYVSTDTTITAPVGEAFVRGKIAIIPDGYGAALPYCEGTIVIPVDPKLTGPMTEEMLQYQPHHRGREMPLLRIDDVRHALRAAFVLTSDQRREMGRLASLVMECAYGPTIIAPAYLKEFQRLVKDKEVNATPAVCVSWEGSFLDYGSLSCINRSLTEALGKTPDLEVHRVSEAGQAGRRLSLNSLAETLETRAPQHTRVTVRHQWPPDWSRPKSGALAVIQPWEFGSLPREWVAAAVNVDEFWVPSTHVRDVYIDSGIPSEKVHVIPNGIDPATYRPGVRPIALPTSRKFKFLFVGGTIGRKGPDVLLKAFLEAFTAADDVCLVIKDFGGNSVYKGMTLSAEIETAKRRPNGPEILYLNQELLPEEMPGLYAACDCLVHPYRGEGFGMPVLEAMACGLPVIVTAGGSTDDFVNESCGWRIQSEKKSLGPTVGGLALAGDGWWLEPSSEELVSRLRFVAAHPDEAKRRGRAGSEIAHRAYTWGTIAEQSAVRIRALAAHPHSHSIHAKRELPAVATLGEIHSARKALDSKQLAEAWSQACAAIAVRPFHPPGWLLLAEIATEAGDVALARRCAARAANLAPKWKTALERLGSLDKLSGTTSTGWSPPEISPTPRLSVCLIAKNEERFLAQCLKSAKPIADQIIVVDTGSSDRTAEIAREFGAEIYSFTWCDDFAAARNAALEHARGDWILVLDADEEISPSGLERVRQEMADPSVMGWRIPIVDAGREAEGRSFIPRLFRNAPGIFYQGRVHEHAFDSVQTRCLEWALENRLGQTELIHHGYTKELTVERGKVQRNLRLLELAVQESPRTPLLLMNLGLELVRSGRTEEGLARYREAFTAMAVELPSNVVPELREMLLTQFASHLYAARRPREVAQVLDSPLARQSELTASQHYVFGMALVELGEFAEAVGHMRKSLARLEVPALTPHNPEILNGAPRHGLALCLWKLKQLDAAEGEFRRALNEQPNSIALQGDYARFLADQEKFGDALQFLHGLVSAQPQLAALWICGAKIALSRRDLLEVALDWTTVAVEQLPENTEIVALRAEALLLSGQTAEALPLWTQLPSENPSYLAARILSAITCEQSAFHVEPEHVNEVSREFLRWYTRLVEMGAEATVVQVLERVNAVSTILPEAAAVLQAILKELAAPSTNSPAH